MSLIVSMAAFALAASITPGPVNIVALSSGAQFGFRASQRHVAGATLGFVLLLVLMGLGLHEVLKLWPFMTRVVQLAGTIEEQLLGLLLQSAPSGQPGQDHAYELAGPVVDGDGRTDVVNDQQQVDDLLASLGF